MSTSMNTTSSSEALSQKLVEESQTTTIASVTPSTSDSDSASKVSSEHSLNSGDVSTQKSATKMDSENRRLLTALELAAIFEDCVDTLSALSSAVAAPSLEIRTASSIMEDEFFNRPRLGGIHKSAASTPCAKPKTRFTTAIFQPVLPPISLERFSGIPTGHEPGSCLTVGGNRSRNETGSSKGSRKNEGSPLSSGRARASPGISDESAGKRENSTGKDGGSSGKEGGRLGKKDGSSGKELGSSEKKDGNSGKEGGRTGKKEGSSLKEGGSSGKKDGSSSKKGGSTGQIEGSSGKEGGDSAKKEGNTEKEGGSTGKKKGSTKTHSSSQKGEQISVKSEALIDRRQAENEEEEGWLIKQNYMTKMYKRTWQANKETPKRTLEDMLKNSGLKKNNPVHKLQADMGAIKLMMADIFNELCQKGTFESLEQHLEQERDEINKVTYAANRMHNKRQYAKKLQADINEVRHSKKKELQVLKLLEHQLEDEEQELRTRTCMESAYTTNFANAQEQQSGKKSEILPKQLEKELKKVDIWVIIEDVAHEAMTKYLGKRISEMTHKLEYWVDRYEVEKEQLMADLDELKEERAAKAAHRADLERKLRLWMPIIKDDRRVRRKKQEELDHMKRMVRAETKLAARWRGHMVRAGLGRFGQKMQRSSF